MILCDPHNGLLQCTEDQWDKIFDNNVKAAFLLTKLVVPHMRKADGGNIVFVSSIAGYQPIPVSQGTPEVLCPAPIVTARHRVSMHGQ